MPIRIVWEDEPHEYECGCVAKSSTPGNVKDLIRPCAEAKKILAGAGWHTIGQHLRRDVFTYAPPEGDDA